MHFTANANTVHTSRVSASRAFTRGDLIIFSGAMVLMMLTALPSVAGRRERSDRVSCMNNLKQIGQAFLSWSEDHDDQFQFRTHPRNGGSYGYVIISQHLGVLSNHLSTPAPLTCPGLKRVPAATFTSLHDVNISYSLGVHAQPIRPQSLLGADWDIEGGETEDCSVPGTIGTKAFIGTAGVPESLGAFWSATNHGRSGQILTSDGAVQSVDGPGLRRALSKSVFEADTREHIFGPGNF